MKISSTHPITHRHFDRMRKKLQKQWKWDDTENATVRTTSPDLSLVINRKSSHLTDWPTTYSRRWRKGGIWVKRVISHLWVLVNFAHKYGDENLTTLWEETNFEVWVFSQKVISMWHIFILFVRGNMFDSLLNENVW